MIVTLFPHVNDDCIASILSLLDKPTLAILGRVSQASAIYCRPWLVRDINLSTAEHFASLDICRFILRHNLGRHIIFLSILPPSVPLWRRAGLFDVLDWSTIGRSMCALADVAETAVNVTSFRMDPRLQCLFSHEPRLPRALKQMAHLQLFDLGNIGRTDVHWLSQRLFAGLRYLRLTLVNLASSEELLSIITQNHHTLAELAVTNSSTVLRLTIPPDTPPCTHVQKVAFYNIEVQVDDFARVFPAAQHVAARMDDAPASPFALQDAPPHAPRPVLAQAREAHQPALFRDVRSVAGPLLLTALVPSSQLRRLALAQPVTSSAMLLQLLQVMQHAPLASVSLSIAARLLPDETSPPFSNQWTIPLNALFAMLASSLPHARYLDLTLGSDIRADASLEGHLTEFLLPRPCGFLAALKNLKFLSLLITESQVNGAEAGDARPKLPRLSNGLLKALPSVEYVVLRTWGWYGLQPYNAAAYQRRRSGLSSPGRGVHEGVDISEEEARAARRRYEWDGTEIPPWKIEMGTEEQDR